jgi:predicted ATPase
MLFEDLHWADPSSLESLDALRERLEHLPLLLVATCRSEFRPQWIGQPGVTALTLGRLGAEQTRAVAARVAGDKELPDEILEQIVAKTDGIPLFVEELTKAILESGSLRVDDRRYELSTPLASLAIPSTLRDSLMARLDRLGPIKEVAQIAACIDEFQQRRSIARARKTQVQEALDQLVASELVFIRGQESDMCYVFKHAIIQEAAYDSLLKTRRAQIHKRIAEELERHFPQTKETEPELLAHHYSAAGLTSRST